MFTKFAESELRHSAPARDALWVTCEQTYRRTDRHTDTLITVLRSHASRGQRNDLGTGPDLLQAGPLFIKNVGALNI